MYLTQPDLAKLAVECSMSCITDSLSLLISKVDTYTQFSTEQAGLADFSRARVPKLTNKSSVTEYIYVGTRAN